MNVRHSYITPGHACRRPSVANMDHVAGFNPDERPMVNRYCLTCGTHWYGDALTAVFQIPQCVWDRWLAEPTEAVA